MDRISVDLGYGYVKAVDEHGKTVMFPSLVGTGNSRYLDSGMGGSTPDAVNSLDVIVGGNRYFVGELARREARDATYAYEQNKINHPNTKVLLFTALALLQDRLSPVHLVTGLPVQHLDLQQDQMRKALTGTHCDVEFVSGPLAGTRRAIFISDVTVFPQAGASVFHQLLNPDGSLKRPEILEKPGYVGVIDVGFRTTDYVVLDIENGAGYIQDLSGTIDVGYNDIFRKVKQFVEHETGETVDLPDIEKAVSRHSITYNGRDIDLSATIARAHQTLAKEIRDKIAVEWPKRKFYKEVLLAGGGVASLLPYLKDLHQAVEMVDDPQMANAFGYMALSSITG